MKKTISVYQRNYETDRLIRDEVVPGAEWVLDGEGVATRKWDGTPVLFQGGQHFKRYDAKGGKTPPEGFLPAQDPDPVTGHWPGWVAIKDGPEDKWLRNAITNTPIELEHGATYEACGPHFQGNPDCFERDILVRHGEQIIEGFPRDFVGMREYLVTQDIEGVVFHHPDGRMAKVKKKDFGLKRKP